MDILGGKSESVSLSDPDSAGLETGLNPDFLTSFESTGFEETGLTFGSATTDFLGGESESVSVSEPDSDPDPDSSDSDLSRSGAFDLLTCIFIFISPFAGICFNFFASFSIAAGDGSGRLLFAGGGVTTVLDPVFLTVFDSSRSIGTVPVRLTAESPAIDFFGGKSESVSESEPDSSDSDEDGSG
ncbi:hypothetical protein HanIR_Chr11g0543691 [Helianthus annuus]|nr:hypothetical protein HanIR_Chr11g0543691 [Helianthus annuus]